MDNYRVRIYEIDEKGWTKNSGKSFDVKAKNEFSAIDEAFKVFIEIPEGGSLSSTGIKVIYDAEEGIKSSYKGHENGCRYERVSFVMTYNNGEIVHKEWQGTPCIKRPDGTIEECKKHYGIDIYQPGFVISTGETVHGLYNSSEAFITSITSRNGYHLKTSAIGRAKRFKDRKSLLNFLKKYESVMEMFTDQNGFKWSWKYSDSCFEEDDYLRRNTLSPKKLENELSCWKEIEKILAGINSRLSVPEPGEDEDEEDELVITDEEVIKAEALDRMEDLFLSENAIRAFETEGKIFYSEGNGMLYDLDEKALLAVNEAKKTGLYPYHVVRNNTTIGEMYSVLYVSKYHGDWKFERYNVKRKILSAYVYNVDGGFADIGDIAVDRANGGLVRIG